MENTTEPKPTNPMRGIAHFSLDIWLGAAAISAVSYLLFRWSADLFSLSTFWGYESTPFGLYVNTLKTAATLSLILATIAAFINGENGRLSHIFLLGYALINDQADPPITKQEVRKTKTISAVIGGSLLTLLIAFFYLPMLARLSFLPGNLTLNAEPLSINSTVPEGIVIEQGHPIESTIDQNFFTLHLKGRNDYLILVEPLEEDSGHYGLSSSLARLAQGDIFISSSGSTQDNRYDWVVVSSRGADRLDFEVLYTGNGSPSSYRLHVYENITDNQNILDISASEISNNQNIYTYQFQAQKDTPYIFLVWPGNEEGTISISLEEEDGRNYPAALANKMDVALLTPESTDTYNISIRNPHGQLSNGFTLLILSEEPASEEAASTNNASRPSLTFYIVNLSLICYSLIFVLFSPLLAIRIIHTHHNRRNQK